MSKPTFQFTAASTVADEGQGLAIWRYTVQRRGEPVEVIVRQRFDTFEAAHAINEMIGETMAAGERAGYALCERRVLASLKGGICG